LGKSVKKGRPGEKVPKRGKLRKDNPKKIKNR